MNKKIILSYLCLMPLFFSWTLRGDIKSKVQELDALFKDTSYSEYYVQLMVLSVETPVDPPPTIDNFEKTASAIINISSHSCYFELRKLIEGLKKMELKEYLHDGYPNWMWRVKGPLRYEGLTIMVDVNNNLLFMEGRWYVVKPEIRKLVVDQFINSLNNTMRGAITGEKP